MSYRDNGSFVLPAKPPRDVLAIVALGERRADLAADFQDTVVRTLLDIPTELDHTLTDVLKMVRAQAELAEESGEAAVSVSFPRTEETVELVRWVAGRAELFDSMMFPGAVPAPLAEHLDLYREFVASVARQIEPGTA